MTSITIRNLENKVMACLRVRATEHNRSIEEEVRVILGDAVKSDRTYPQNLAAFTKECFASLGGVELELPPRNCTMREPPDFT